MEEILCLADTVTCNILILLYVKSGDIGVAATCLLKMKMVGEVPDIMS